MRRGKPTTQAATKKRRQEQQHDTPTPARKAGKLGDLLAPAATVTKEQLRQRAVYGAKLLLAIKRICDLCGPKQGHILSKDARGILLIVVFMVQYLLMCSRTMAIKIVAQLCHVSARCTLEPLANHWDEVGDVLVTTGSSRGVGGLNHPLATKMLQAIHLNSIDGDYHKNMDGEMFMKWIRERLLPAVEKLYPDKKVYFVLDNAPYHHHVSGGYDISKANKTQLAQWMVKEGCEEFYDPEAAKTFKVDKAWGHDQTQWRCCGVGRYRRTPRSGSLPHASEPHRTLWPDPHDRRQPLFWGCSGRHR